MRLGQSLGLPVWVLQPWRQGAVENELVQKFVGDKRGKTWLLEDDLVDAADCPDGKMRLDFLVASSNSHCASVVANA